MFNKTSSPTSFPGANTGLLSRLKRDILIRLGTIGINPRKLLALRFFPRYIADWLKFKRAGGIITDTHEILDEFETPAGLVSGHYFHQDLLVATFIHDAKPLRHIDIGSRVDGFVAHVAAFREIEIIDIRPLKGIEHDNIKYFQADLMSDSKGLENIADSVSCLHAIEHFGLGRYGDPIDPNGHIKGFINIYNILKQNGMLYISFPIGRSNSVHFNAHRVFHPHDIFSWTEHKLKLSRFDFVDDDGLLHRNWPLLEVAPETKYGCGIYSFVKS